MRAMRVALRVEARDVVADADRRELHRRARFDVVDDLPQVLVEIVVAVGGERGLVHRRAVGDDDEDAAAFAAGEQAAVRPEQRLAVDVLLEHLVVQEQAERRRGRGATARRRS